MTETTTPRRWYQRPVLWIVAALAVAFLAFFGPRLLRLPGLVRQAKVEAAYWKGLQKGGIQALSRAGAVDEAQTHLDAARTLAASARRDWRFALDIAPAFGWLPGVGGDLAALPHLADAGQALLDGGAALLQACKPALADLPQGAGKALASLSSAIPAQSDALTQAEEAFGRAAVAWDRVDATRLSPRLARYAPLADEALRALAATPDALRLLPHLLGADGPKRYLILAQNSDEIRATGGFISAVGILQVDKGQIKSLTLGDSYTIMDLTKPHPIPPIALETHMWAQILLLRDANWWADFPTSAQKAWELYEQDTGKKADGVIAFDTPALQLLVDAAEPVSLKDYKDTITADNLMERIQHYWASPVGAPSITSEDPNWWGQRKKFMGVLAKAVMDRLLKDTAKLDTVEVARAAFRLLNERHVLLYLPPAQDVLRRQKWDGAMVVPTDSDTLFVVDSNVGFNKVNPVVQQALTYTVNLANTPPTALLQIRYTHSSKVRLDECVHESRYGDTYQNMMDRCYWDYIRVFAPSGAELMSREGLEDGDLAEPEVGRAVWDGLMVLKPGETREVAFRYRLPAVVISNGQYRLYVQKQSGTWGIPLRVVIKGAGGKVSEFQTDLTEDRNFAVGP
jgi:hypothetical protein